MADPWGIVLVPTKEGRALLEDGPCGSRPPAVRWMSRMAGGRGCWIEPAASRGGGPGSVIALPLRWDNALVNDGWDRARRVWWNRPRGPRVDVTVSRAAWLAFPLVEDVLVLACGLEADGLCRVVLLDLVDGAVRERAT